MKDHLEARYIRHITDSGVLTIIPYLISNNGKTTAGIHFITNSGIIKYSAKKGYYDAHTGILVIDSCIFSKSSMLINISQNPIIEGSASYILNKTDRHGGYCYNSRGRLNIGGDSHSLTGRAIYREFGRNGLPHHYAYCHGEDEGCCVLFSAKPRPINTWIDATIYTPNRKYTFNGKNGAKLLQADEDGFCLKRGKTLLRAERLNSGMRYSLTSCGCLLNSFDDENAVYNCSFKRK